MNYQRYAFCIGSNGPNSVYPALKYAAKDAYILAKSLKSSPCNFVAAEAITAVNPYNTLKQLAHFLKECELGSPDLLVVHFSGHAIYDENLYLICDETDYDTLIPTAIKIDDIKAMLSSNLSIRYKVLILDCCHAAGSHLGAFKGDFDLRDAVDRALQGSANVIVSACARFERTRELSTLNGGSGLLTSIFVAASTTSLKDVSRDGYSLSLSDIVRWIPKFVQEINSPLAEKDQLPLPSILSETRGGDGEIWLTEPRELAPPINIQSKLHGRRQLLNEMLEDHTSFLRIYWRVLLVGAKSYQISN